MEPRYVSRNPWVLFQSGTFLCRFSQAWVFIKRWQIDLMKIHGCSAKIWLLTLWCSGNPYGRISLIVKTWIDIRQVNAWGWLSFFEIIDMVWCRQAVDNWIFWNVFTLLKVNRVASILAQVKVKEWMNKAEDKWERLKFS